MKRIYLTLLISILTMNAVFGTVHMKDQQSQGKEVAFGYRSPRQGRVVVEFNPRDLERPSE